MRSLLWLAILLVGCSTSSGMNDQVQKFNSIQEAKFAPTRMKFVEFPGGASSLQSGVWAGEPSVTVANARFQSSIFDKFRVQCGFDENQLKEVRVVKHEPSLWYEVWVFNNPDSRRPDKTTGLSVVMRFNPTTNMTSTSFYGDC